MIAAIATLLPAFLVIGASAYVGRKSLSDEAIKGLSNLTFSLLLPALLFRAMVTFQFDAQHAKALAGYFIPSIFLLLSTLVFLVKRKHASTAHAACFAFACTFGNTVQMGIPLTTLAFGQEGLGLLLSLIAIHALILLTMTTLIVEFSQARSGNASLLQSILPTMKATVIHPVILPILAGLLCSAIGVTLPPWLDAALKYLADAAGPLCLVLLGAQLGKLQVGKLWIPAAQISVLKLFVHPLLVCGTLYLLGVRGVPLYALTTVAALPTGTNAFLFAQRYETDVNTVTAAIAISTLVSALTYTIALTLVRFL